MKIMNKEDFFRSFKNQSYVNQLKEIPQNLKAIHNEETKTSEVTIYGVIGNSWWDDSFSASDVDRILNEAGDNDIIIHLNSPGGDAFDGIAIYNRLKKHNGKVTINVDGWACSAASIIAMAADELNMGLGSMFMIHEASTIVWGTKTEMRKEAEMLEELEEGMIDIYMTKSKASREEVRAKVDAETWFSAKKAVEIGFASNADGMESEEEPAVVVTNSAQDREKIMNDLKNTLKQNNQTNEPYSNSVNPEEKKGSFNLLKKWRS